MLKRAISFFLCLAMVFSMVPVQAFAEEETTAPSESITESTKETTASTEAETEPTERITAPAEPVPEARKAAIHSVTAAKDAVAASEPGGTITRVPYGNHVHEFDAEQKCACGIYGGTNGENQNWTLDSEGTLTVCGEGVIYGYEDGYPWLSFYGLIRKVVIEEGIHGIGPNAFEGLGNTSYGGTGELSVQLPDTLLEMGDRAFYRSALRDVIVPEGVTRLQYGVFNACENLCSITLPSTLEEIEEYACYETAITELTVPEGVTTIRSMAFAACENLSNVTLPESLLSIGDSSFSRTALTEVVIPDNVVSVGAEAFSSCETLSKVTLPENLELLGEDAFSYTALQEITVPQKIKTIPRNVFFRAEALESVILPDGIESIGEFAFGFTALQEITIPEKVERIESYAFYACENLEKVIFTGDAPEIGELIFNKAAPLSALYPKGNETWTEEIRQDYGSEVTWTAYGDDVVDRGTCGESVSWILTDDGVLTISGTGPMEDTYWPYETAGEATNFAPWYPYAGSIRQVIVEDGITGISHFAFFGCEKLESVEISESVTHVGCAFVNSALEELTIPAGVTSLTYPSSEGVCAGLKKIIVSPENTVYSSDEAGLLYDKEKTRLLGCPTGFEGACTVADTVTAIGDRAFIDCVGIMDILLPESVTEIGIAAFQGCTGLERIDIPEKLQKVGMMSFAGCAALKYVIIPGEVMVLEQMAFGDCTAMQQIWFTGDAPQIGEDSFYQVTATAYYPQDNDTWTEEIREDYGGSLTWEPYSGEIPDLSVVAEGTCGEDLTWTLNDRGILTVSGTGAMEDYNQDEPWRNYQDAILKVVLEEGITRVGNYSFKQYASLNTVILPDTVESVGYAAFSGTALRSVAIPESTVILEDYAFFDCGFLSNVTFSQGLLTIGDYAFQQTSITQTELPEGLVTIGSGAFSEVPLEVVNIPATVRNIGSSAFWNTHISEIEIPGEITEIKPYTFAACSSLSRVTLPESLETIGEYSFSGTILLKEIYVPKNVTSIGRNAFQFCERMEMIVFEGSAPAIAADSFSNVNAMVYYPANDPRWTGDKLLNYGGSLTWVPYGYVENRVALDKEILGDCSVVCIDGVTMEIQKDGDFWYVDLPDSNAGVMTTYAYHTDETARDAVNVHTVYPISMQVWTLKNRNGAYTATRQEIFDDILQYSGMSIRVAGKKGIRMITSIDRNTKNSLISDGMAGYTLKEYGTVVAWATQLKNGNPLVLGASYVKSNYAYKQGVADPVFACNRDVMQYTNVLVGFSPDQCKNDLAIRPYMILEDADGNEIILYGGIVQRSIGYIAEQNAYTFDPTTEAGAYNYIWDIIHHVYGKEYVPEAA